MKNYQQLDCHTLLRFHHKKLNQSQISKLADELREFLLYTVGKTGGHFGAGLGVIELTLALHYKFQGMKL